jgi:hypothetical protein
VKKVERGAPETHVSDKGNSPVDELHVGPKVEVMTLDSFDSIDRIQQGEQIACNHLAGDWASRVTVA